MKENRPYRSVRLSNLLFHLKLLIFPYHDLYIQVMLNSVWKQHKCNTQYVLIHPLFWITSNSKNSQNWWFQKLEKERKKWNKAADHQLDTIKCYLWSQYDPMAFFKRMNYPQAFFCSGNFACFFSSLLCPILKVQSWLSCWALLSSIGFSRTEMPFAPY